MTKHNLTVARATEKEIDNVNDFLNEMASLSKHFSNEFAFDAINSNKDEFPVLSKLATKDAEDFIQNISRFVKNMKFEVVLFNLVTLMDNCVDLNSKTLQFNEKFSLLK